jgi:hypothetical protein
MIISKSYFNQPHGVSPLKFIVHVIATWSMLMHQNRNIIYSI